MTRLAIAGAGLIGKRHAKAIAECEYVVLSAVVDPADTGKQYAIENNIPWYPSLQALFNNDKPDGVILATPNKVHVENGLECVLAKCPMLVEKPLATTAEQASRLVAAAKSANVAILVGHHRRYNPLIRKAHELISSGKIGQLRAVHANCWLYKPDEYFDEAPWRKAVGAGPVSVNLVHDIDLLRYLCGDVHSVQAQKSPSMRGYENEDVSAAVLTFKNGALGTISVSDSIVAPWSWELTARENPAYPATSQSCYCLGGSHGSLSLPDLTLWQNNATRSWWQPISATTLPNESADPLVKQIIHFSAVIAGNEKALVSGEEGLKTLQVSESIQLSAISGEQVVLPS